MLANRSATINIVNLSDSALGAGSRLEFNQEAVSQALKALPADLLEFRILFPEMRQ